MSKLLLLLVRSGRDLVAMRYRAVAISLIIASGLAIFVGVYSAIGSLFATRDDHYRRGSMADLEVRFVPEDRANLPSLADIPGVAAVESRLVIPGNLELGGGRRIAATLVAVDLTGPRRLNQLQILDGGPLRRQAPEHVLIERGLARYHGLAVGDALHLEVGRDVFDNLRVEGVALSPEHLLASADPSLLLPSKGSLGVVFAPLELMTGRLGFPLVNSLLLGLDEGADAAAVRAAVEARSEGKLTIEEIIPRREQFSYLFLEKDLNAFALFVPAIIAVFALTAVLVTLFLLFQWITGQRREIGVLMALGYGKARLVAAYAAPVAALGAVALAAGYALSFLTLHNFGGSYAGAIGLPSPRLSLQPSLLLWGALGVVAALALAMAWPQARLLRLTPQAAVRGEGEEAPTRPGLLARLLAGWMGGRLWLRYAVRNVVRGKAVTAMTVASVALALGVAISYFIAMTSFRATLVAQFAEDRWDVAVDFLAPVWEDELDMFEAVEGITTLDPYLRAPVRVEAGGERRSSLLTGVAPASTLRRLRLLAGRSLVPGDGEALLLEKKAADELGLAPGDTLTVVAQGERHRARLVGVFSGTLPGESYTTLAAARRWLDLEDQASGVFLQTSVPAEEIRPRLFRLERVARVTLKDELVAELVELVREVLVILYLTEAFSIAVAALFIFSSAAFTILHRRSEYGMLRILGFGERSVAAMVLAEITLLGLAGAALAVPLGYGLATALTARLSAAWFTVAITPSPGDFLIILVPALVLLPLAALPALRNVLRADLPTTLRERRFG